MGSDGIALPLLEWLVGEGSAWATVIAVYTQPDRAVGRGQKVQANAIKMWALSRGLPVFQPEKVTEETRVELAGLNADVSLVMAYGHILKDAFIAAPRLGTLNLHASILPKYRGASPIQTAVANGEKETGVSLMRILRKLDAGPVADVERVAIEPRDTTLEIEGKLAGACVPLLKRTLPKLAEGTLVFVEQDEARATFCRKLAKEDGALDFNQPAAVIAARVNGLFPWPACSVEIGGQVVKLGLAEVAAEGAGSGDGSSVSDIGSRPEAGAPGEVIGADAEGLLVATGGGAVRLLRLQRPGGKMLVAAEFLRGFTVAAGTRIESRALPVLVGSQPFPYKK
ncbi:methionyl-tRNA formyltransferase [Nibricoccus aquaticus]|uniref:Methionyl-tRNA formyltransferase n=2 Tax=Nibricoccus aquaticus TaxID=2576891 RepID=A0A290QNK4_9BACT|nr:methionyl-tRNA formyltransferase [Nibricoccus aquaticus]